jgi:electron transport complex protein RnfG
VLLKSMLRSGLFLAVFAVAGVGLVALSHEGTRERIAANERAALLRSLHAVVAPQEHDNDILEDVIRVQSPTALGTEDPVAVYRARKDGKPVAAVLTPVAPDGYNGSIRLMVGVYYDGRLAGVRVLSHQETPGLGDAVDERRSDWILGFRGRSLKDPGPGRWKVKRDGGAFDQFTGATITPRAVVGAVYRALRYFEAHRDSLFAETPETTSG